MKFLTLICIATFISSIGAANADLYAMNCGPNTLQTEKILTKSHQVTGLVATLDGLHRWAQRYLAIGRFAQNREEIAVTFRDYKIEQILRNESRICVIYTGKIVVTEGVRPFTYP